MSKILLIVALSFCGYAFAESNPPSPTPAKGSNQEQAKFSAKHEATKDLRGTYELPLVVDVRPAPNADKIAEQKNEQESEKSTLDRLSAWSTVALAVITFFLALFTAFLWWKTRELVKDAKDAANRQLRAYITFQKAQLFATQNGIMVDPPRQIFAGCRPTCTTVFINSGQTPAYDVEMGGTIGLVK